MRQCRSFRLALWLLDRMESTARQGNLSGDLLEEVEGGKSVRWFWYQVSAAILIQILARFHRFGTLLAFAAGWTTLYPWWRKICVGGSAYTVDHYKTLAWPWSSISPIIYGVMPAVLFVWLGYAAYTAISGSRNWHLAYEQCFALSTGTSLIFAASFAVLRQLGHPQIIIGELTRTDFFLIDHFYFISAPIVLSVWVTLLIGTHTPHVARPRRRKFPRWWISTPRTITILAVALILCSSAYAQSSLTPEPTHGTDDELIRVLRTKLSEDTAAGKFSGVVLIAKNGSPLFEQAYGLADNERKVANTTATRFRIGSINKVFTAVATLQLVQAKKLKLDDPLINYIPDYPNKDLAQKVTIRELLNHTGGTGDIFGTSPNQLFSEEYKAHRLKLKTLDDYIHLYGDRPLRFQPGSRFEYSNYGYILLGKVIEKASREDYYDYMKKHIYGPAGMKLTGELPMGQEVLNLSIGYTTMDGNKASHANTDSLPYRGLPAGMGYSTVSDLFEFSKALQQHKLLDSPYTSLMMTGTVEMPRDGSYGYGLMVHPLHGQTCLGHAGGYPGMNADVELCNNSEYVVVVLANVDPPVAQRLGFFIANWVTQSRQ